MLRWMTIVKRIEKTSTEEIRARANTIHKIRDVRLAIVRNITTFTTFFVPALLLGKSYLQNIFTRSLHKSASL